MGVDIIEGRTDREGLIEGLADIGDIMARRWIYRNSNDSPGKIYWDDYYDWYRTEGYKKIPWAEAVPGLHAFFDIKDRQKMASDYSKNTGFAPAYVTKRSGYLGNSSLGKIGLGFSIGTLYKTARKRKTVNDYHKMW